jgi:hypothetical protein
MWLIGYQTHIVNDFWAFVSIFKQWKQNESLTLNIHFHDYKDNIFVYIMFLMSIVAFFRLSRRCGFMVELKTVLI